MASEGVMMPQEAGEEIRQISKQEVRQHSDPTSCWIIINDGVYDVTPFLREHPGGMEILLEKAGMDATHSFVSKGHTDDARKILATLKIGQLSKNDRFERE